MLAVGRGEHGIVVAYFLCMVYYITGTKLPTHRFSKGINMWADFHGYKMVLGDSTTSRRRMRLHGLTAIVKRKHLNSYGTTMSGKLARCCGIRILKDVVYADDFQLSSNQMWVEVTDHLPDSYKEMFRERYLIEKISEE